MAVRIIENGSYLPKQKVTSKNLEEKLGLEKGYIEKRTGIKLRYFAQEETIEQMAIEAVRNLFKKIEPKEQEEVGLILVATTSSKELMPGISNSLQKELKIKNCICLDILAGCSGYINAFDIASLYLEAGKMKKALVVGVDKLSDYTDPEDIGTAIILSDGAGATLLEKESETKKYASCIQTQSENNQILTCKVDDKIQMDGKKVYQYAVTKTVQNIQELLKQTDETLENIKYIVPHQSNRKIMKAMGTRLQIPEEKMYQNIQDTGNTFCASIPIVLNEIMEKQLLKQGDKIIMIGYGGGLNTGSILIEI